jgi:hypothetical protein
MKRVTHLTANVCVAQQQLPPIVENSEIVHRGDNLMDRFVHFRTVCLHHRH